MKLNKTYHGMCCCSSSSSLLLLVTAMAAGSIEQRLVTADGYKVAVVDTTTPIFTRKFPRDLSRVLARAQLLM